MKTSVLTSLLAAIVLVVAVQDGRPAEQFQLDVQRLSYFEPLPHNAYILVDGIRRDLPWEDTFDAGTSVTLEAVVEDPGWFSEFFTGNYFFLGNPITVVMDADKTFTAASDPDPAMYCRVDMEDWVGVGDVDIFFEPPQSGPYFAPGTTITLVVEADEPGWVLAGIFDHGDLTPLTIVAEPGGDHSFSVYFRAVLNIISDGPGRVLIDGEGPYDLPWSRQYEIGWTQPLVSIEALPDPGYLFSHWTLEYHEYSAQFLDNPLDFSAGLADYLVAHFVPDAEIASAPTSCSFQVPLGADAFTTDILVWNGSSSGTLEYEIATSPSWLSCLPTTGSSTGGVNTHVLTIDPGGLAAGCYAGTVTVTNLGNPSDVVKIPVSLGVGEFTLTIDREGYYGKVRVNGVLYDFGEALNWQTGGWWSAPLSWTFPAGTSVTLEAVEEHGWQWHWWFAYWSDIGDLFSTISRIVKMDRDRSFTMLFYGDPVINHLEPRYIYGFGEVVIDPVFPDHSWLPGTTVTMTAVPAGPGWAFEQWLDLYLNGHEYYNETPITFVAYHDLGYGVSFIPVFRVLKAGNGTVLLDGSPIDLPYEVRGDSSVWLEALPDPGYLFSHWTSEYYGHSKQFFDNPLNFWAGIAYEITAHFTPIPDPMIAFEPTSFTKTCCQGSGVSTDSLLVWNGGGGTLNTIVETTPSWLTVAPPGSVSTGTAQVHIVSFDCSVLAPGDHAGTITLTDPAAVNDPATIPVSLRIIPTVTIGVGEGSGRPGDAGCTVPIRLDNATSVSSLLLTLVDTPDWLTVTDVVPTSRAAGLVATVDDQAGVVSILLESAGGDPIAPGTGPVCILAMVVDPAAPEPSTVVLDVSEAHPVDVNATQLCYVAAPGAFYIDQPPELMPIADMEVDEWHLLTIPVTATDPNGDPIALSAAPLPDGAVFEDHGDGTGMFAWMPAHGQAGSYDLTFEAHDGRLTDHETITITVHPWGGLGDLFPSGAPDGAHDLFDVVRLVDLVLERFTPTAYELWAADIAPMEQPDGIADMLDVDLLVDWVLGRSQPDAAPATLNNGNDAPNLHGGTEGSPWSSEAVLVEVYLNGKEPVRGLFLQLTDIPQGYTLTDATAPPPFEEAIVEAEQSLSEVRALVVSFLEEGASADHDPILTLRFQAADDASRWLPTIKKSSDVLIAGPDGMPVERNVRLKLVRERTRN